MIRRTISTGDCSSNSPRWDAGSLPRRLGSV